MNERYNEMGAQQAQIAGSLAGAQGLGRGYAQEQASRGVACAETTATAEPLVQVAKRIEVTVQGPLTSPRTEREFREELAGKLAAGYRVIGRVEQRGRVVIYLEKFENWSLDEFIGDVKAKVST